MTTKQNFDEQKDPEVVIESAIGKTEAFIEKNGKSLLTTLLVVVLVVGGYFGYKYLWVAPRTDKAADMMYVAQQQFAVDSFAMALSGDGNNSGFLDVIAKYGSTPQGNLAAHYAGICYLETKDYDNALKYLSKYKATTGVPNEIINAQNLGLQGDVYAQQNKIKEAASQYEKAAKSSKNSLTAPFYMKKAGLAYLSLGEKAKAIALFEQISENYGTSMEARDIEKYVGFEEQK